MGVLLPFKRKIQFRLEGKDEHSVRLISMESFIDFVRCDKPGIIDIEISGSGNIEQKNWRENGLWIRDKMVCGIVLSENLSYFVTRL